MNPLAVVPSCRNTSNRALMDCTAFDGNPKRIHVTGHSAGAHIGALLAADAHYLANEGRRKGR